MLKPPIAGDVQCASAVSPAADAATTAGSDDALHAAVHGTYVDADEDPSAGSDAAYAACLLLLLLLMLLLLLLAIASLLLALPL